MFEKYPLGINVLEAAQQRIAWVFDTFPRIYVSFSGGKDSTVMLHPVLGGRPHSAELFPREWQPAR